MEPAEMPRASRGRPKGLPKSGGRVRGTPNKPKPVVLSPDEEAQNRVMTIVTPSEVRSPKAVMLDAMMFLDRMARDHFEKQDYATALKYMQASVQVAEKVAPYTNARLIAVQGEAAADKPAYVIRAPSVMEDSSVWQASVGAAVMDMEASAARTEVLAHPAQQQPVEPQTAPQPAAVALVADPKTNRITVMPPGPRVVQSAGTQEWLDSIKKVG
jgi:hypothetical protein